MTVTDIEVGTKRSLIEWRGSRGLAVRAERTVCLHDRYPKDYGEFITEIIKANSISLPELPRYQEYSYVEKEHKLVILKYPDRKNQPAQ